MRFRYLQPNLSLLSRRIAATLALAAPVLFVANTATGNCITPSLDDARIETYRFQAKEQLSVLLHMRGVDGKTSPYCLYGRRGWVGFNQRHNPEISDWDDIAVGTAIDLYLPKTLGTLSETMPQGEFDNEQEGGVMPRPDIADAIAAPVELFRDESITQDYSDRHQGMSIPPVAATPPTSTVPTGPSRMRLLVGRFTDANEGSLTLNYGAYVGESDRPLQDDSALLSLRMVMSRGWFTGWHFSFYRSASVGDRLQDLDLYIGWQRLRTGWSWAYRAGSRVSFTLGPQVSIYSIDAVLPRRGEDLLLVATPISSGSLFTPGVLADAMLAWQRGALRFWLSYDLALSTIGIQELLELKTRSYGIEASVTVARYAARSALALQVFFQAESQRYRAMQEDALPMILEYAAPFAGMGLAFKF